MLKKIFPPTTKRLLQSSLSPLTCKSLLHPILPFHFSTAAPSPNQQTPQFGHSNYITSDKFTTFQDFDLFTQYVAKIYHEKSYLGNELLLILHTLEVHMVSQGVEKVQARIMDKAAPEFGLAIFNVLMHCVEQGQAPLIAQVLTVLTPLRLQDHN